MKPIETITDAQSHALIAALNTPRNRVLGLLMLDAGLRVGEAVQLTPFDVLTIDPNQPDAGLSPCHVSPVLTVPTTAAKKKRSRIIPMTTRLQQALLTYCPILYAANHNTAPLWLFPTRKGQTHLTTRQARRIIRNVALQAIAILVHPHVLRHTFATNMLRSTDLRTLQLLLGHKQLNTTQIYTHPTAEDLRQAIVKFQNLDRKPGN